MFPNLFTILQKNWNPNLTQDNLQPRIGNIQCFTTPRQKKNPTNCPNRTSIPARPIANGTNN